MTLQIVKERECPNCHNQIIDLRIERKAEQHFEINVSDPTWNDYEPEISNEDDWKAVCYTVATDEQVNPYGNGCMYEFQNFSPDDNAEFFMQGEVDGHGNELTNVKAKMI